jgi:hypothetical protein
MTQLTTQQIDTLAKFAGWEHTDDEKFMKSGRVLRHFTSPRILIKIRLKLIQKYDAYLEIHGNGFTWFEIGALLGELDELILLGKYTEAAIKTCDIILKLEA